MFRALKASLDKVTKTNARVMLEGEPGSGKEMAARYIHMHSARAAAPIRAASAPISARNTRELPATTGIMIDSGLIRIMSNGNAAPTANVAADAIAAWIGRAAWTSESPSSSRA